MKKILYYAIIILSLAGILIEVLAWTFADPVSFSRGLGLIKYFTIQSNLIVFVYFVLGLFDTICEKELYKKFLPGVVIYIAITFVVFAIMLQGTFEITGIRIVGNLLVHYITPILSIIYLFVFNKNIYQVKDMLLWVIYPVVYIIFVVIYGLITKDFLYPFFDIYTNGLLSFIITFIVLLLFFLILSLGAVKILSKIENTRER